MWQWCGKLLLIEQHGHPRNKCQGRRSKQRIVGASWSDIKWGPNVPPSVTSVRATCPTLRPQRQRRSWSWHLRFWGEHLDRSGLPPDYDQHSLCTSRRHLATEQTRFFRKLWAAKAESVAIFHFYCKQCNHFMTEQAGSKELACRTCGQQSSQQTAVSNSRQQKANSRRKEGSLFVIPKIHEQLKHVIMKTKHLLHDVLQRVTTPADSISDITKGQVYRCLRA